MKGGRRHGKGGREEIDGTDAALLFDSILPKGTLSDWSKEEAAEADGSGWDCIRTTSGTVRSTQRGDLEEEVKRKAGEREEEEEDE